MTNTLQTTFDLDAEVRAIFAGERLTDPYPIWTALRETRPVHRVDDMVLVTRYRPVKSMISDHKTYIAQPHIAGSRAEAIVRSFSPEGARLWLELAEGHALQLGHTDGAPHDRLRSIMHRYFTPQVVDAMDGMIRSHIDELLDEAAESDVHDFKQLFQDFGARVMVSVIGSPQADRGAIVAWARRRARYLGSDNEEFVRDAHAAMAEFRAYVDDTILAEHRRNPGSNPLVYSMMSAEDDDNLSAQEMIENIAMVLSAGIETTSTLLSTSLLELLSDRHRWDYLREDSGRIPVAVEELLRYISPGQYVTRAAREDFQLDDVEVRAGETVFGVVAAANRDPLAYDDPDTLRLDRSGPAHLALGFGPKFCLGASLVRLEAREALTRLTERFPNSDLGIDVDELDWSGSNPLLRSVRALPVRLRPTA